jgi:predicted metal-dependent HD superfamily phosphohydrolase
MQFEELYHHVYQIFLRSLPSNLFYHNWNHTIVVVANIEEIAKEEKLNENNLILLKTAALLHDIGFIKKYDNNEDIACDISKEILPNFGYSQNEVVTICDTILATKFGFVPNNILHKIICDADLDYLGRGNFESLSFMLFKEKQAFGEVNSLKEWDEMQIKFISQHQYHTNYAIKNRHNQKWLYLQGIIKRYEENNY